MLNGLDLFSGIGGIALALAPWVRPVAYCEINKYAQSVLLSRIAEGKLPNAPIWDDIKSLSKETFGAGGPSDWDGCGLIDIIYGGFPCQDISVAGHGKGLAGQRSGLFFEIARLAGELRPSFLFLENVPAITTRGGREVVGTLTALGYDCRWLVISAAQVGANHKRERWFLLAHTNSQRGRIQSFSWELQKKTNINPNGQTQFVADAAGPRWETWSSDPNGNDTPPSSVGNGQPAGNGGGILEEFPNTQGQGLAFCKGCGTRQATITGSQCPCWWTVEPDVGRMAYGVPFRVDRIKGLGNAVVPLQARTAFEILSGLRGIA